MWTLVLFDLPVTTKTARNHAARFRGFLQREGYVMLQLSVYAKVGIGLEVDQTTLRRLKNNLPPQGNVRALQVTDAQMARMKILIGMPSKAEEVAPEQLVLL